MRPARSSNLGKPCIMLLMVLSLVADCVRLIREDGFRDSTYYYHLGDGSHAYHYNTETASSVYFKCVLAHKLRCSGRAILRVGGAFRETKAHNHPPDPDFVAERHFRANVLARCGGVQYVTFQDILDDARRNRRYTRRVRSVMTMRRLRNSMSKARTRCYPQPGPQTLQELSQLLLQQRWKNFSCTVDGEDNLYAGSTTATDGGHHVLFMSQRQRNFTSRIKIVQSDGTFKARPNIPPSSQIFALVTPWRNTVIPLSWVLMENRTIPAYRAVFNLIKQVCPNFHPDTIVTDWEYPQQFAWQEAFPNADLQGCLWHLCRSFLKKAKKLRLMRFRRQLPALFDFIRKACAICLLPNQYFADGLRIVRNAVKDADLLIAYLLVPFFTYVEQKWINNQNRNRWMSMFNSSHRTNNCCESHNKSLRKYVGAYRPNVFAFICSLAKMEHNCTLDIQLMDNGGMASRTRRCRSVYTDNALQALSNDLEFEVFRDLDVSVGNFLERAANTFVTAYNDLIGHQGN